jgi:dethiobiotin synthetase
MTAGVFVTGTDTGVGKTLISSALVAALAGLGFKTAGLKPVSAGCVRTDEGWLSEDVVALRAAANVALPLEVINPYAFEPPLAPHIAAAQAGVTIDFGVILETIRYASTMAECLVVEGVGGFRVPLNAHEDTADLAVALDLPVVLVVGMRLGCLSHALLTAESIQARGLRLAGWVANGVDPDMQAQAENLVALKARLPVPCLGYIPFCPSPKADQIAGMLEISRLRDFLHGMV